MNGAEYAEVHGASFEWSSHGFQRDPDGWEHQVFTVTLTVGDVSESFEWRQGLGVERDPEVGNVLECLASDARSGQMDFEEFCAEYGYDEDSRKAYATWGLCGLTAQKLEALFGEIPDVREDES